MHFCLKCKVLFSNRAILRQDIHSVATRASDIVESLIQAQTSLGSHDFQAILDISDVCPNFQSFANVSTFGDLRLNKTNIDIQHAFADLDTFLRVDLTSVHTGFNDIGAATSKLNHSITFVLDKDWLLKLFVVFLNVIVGFFFVAIGFSISSYVNNHFRALLTYLLVPTFCIILVMMSLTTIGLGTATVANADFCSGGNYPGSPEGTIQYLIELRGISDEDRIFQSYKYYVGVSVWRVALTILSLLLANIESN